MPHSDDVAVLPVKGGLQGAVRKALATRDQMLTAADARDNRAKIALDRMTTLASLSRHTTFAGGGFRKEKPKKLQAKKQPQTKPQAPKVRPLPSPAVRIGRMAEEAWRLLTRAEQENGLPLWRLAALANLHFQPVPARRLEYLQGNLLVHQLEHPEHRSNGKRYGWALLSRPLPGIGSQLEGIKIYDHNGSILIAVGHMPVGASEKTSPFTKGIFDGPDVVPNDWVYYTRDHIGSPAITEFIKGCLPLRQKL